MTKSIFCHHAVTLYQVFLISFVALWPLRTTDVFVLLLLLITSPTFNRVSGKSFFKLLCPIMRFSQLLLLPWLMVALNILNEHKIRLMN